MAIVKCDGTTCTNHHYGLCTAEGITLRNMDYEYETDKFTDEQACRSYKYDKNWREKNAEPVRPDGKL